MEYTALSPFMRPITHAHLRLVDAPEPPAMARPVNKWHLLRELSKAQAAYGVTDRDLTVLQGLISFFPDDTLGAAGVEMVVFPSNKAICERLNGMACSTMRRHLARLVAVGLVQRRDSPNGKRYARRDGDDSVSFGFDLTCLHAQAEGIARAAEAVRAAEHRERHLRETVSLMRRDLAAVAAFGEEVLPGQGLWNELRDRAVLTAQALRRRLPISELEALCGVLLRLLDVARDRIDGPAQSAQNKAKSEDMNTNDARSGQHYHNSKTDPIDLELTLKQGQAATVVSDDPTPEIADTGQAPRIPLHLVTASCPSIATFYDGPIRHWHQLYDAACQVRPAMGISPSAWEEAQRCMGPEQAAIVIVAMLERFADIRAPGGYLRALTVKAAAGQFSCGPMVMALLARRKAA